MLIDDELNWSSHVDKVIKISQINISVIRRARTYLPHNSLKLLYNSIVLPPMDYCFAVWSNRYQSQTAQLRKVKRKVKKRAARLIMHMNETYETPSAELFKILKWMTLEERFEFKHVIMYKCLHNSAPSYLQIFFLHFSKYIYHYEPRSQKCLNLLSTGELSNKSLNCLYTVSNQFLIWSQNCLKI